MNAVEERSTHSPVRQRTPQAERSATTKARLCRAAFEQIRDHGYVNFRVAPVTKLARVSQGGYMHHFPTKESLALATMEYAYEDSTAASLERIRSLPADADPIGAVIEDAKNFFFSPHFRVALDILMAGGSVPGFSQQLVGLTLKYRGQVERAWLEKLVDHGWPLAVAEDTLAMTFSLVRGFAMRLLVEPDREHFDRMLERWRTIAGDYKNTLQPVAAPAPSVSR